MLLPPGLLPGIDAAVTVGHQCCLHQECRRESMLLPVLAAGDRCCCRRQVDRQGSMLLPPSETDGKTLIVFHFFLIEILLRYASYLNLSAYQYYINQFALGFLLFGRLAERHCKLLCFFAHFFPIDRRDGI